MKQNNVQNRMCNISRNEIRWLLEEKYGGVKSTNFLCDCERLGAGEPLDYVIGWTEFLGCRIDLSERRFIPRQETEWWVEKVVQSVKRKVQNGLKQRMRVLDLFAGSGCIGIAVLKYIPNARVDFADIEPSCLTQIRKSAEINRIAPGRYRVLRSDVFSAIIGRYDVIFANPPYVAERTAAARLAPSVREFEPHRALFAGADGLDYVRAVLADVSRFLEPRGFLAMEFDDTQADAVRQFLHGSELRGELYQDQYGSMRYLLASR